MTSWSYWLWAIMAQVHGMLKSTFRERRGVVTLLGVPPAVGVALLDYFSRPRPGQGGRKYNEDHPSYKQGTSAGKVYHFIKFAYDCMADVEWAFPLGDLYHKTCADAARLVSRGRFSDLHLWATPVQFKYKWAVQRHLGAPTMGVHTFSVSANVTHIGLEDGQLRFNMEYGRWVAEQQQEQIDAVKRAIKSSRLAPYVLTTVWPVCSTVCSTGRSNRRLFPMWLPPPSPLLPPPSTTARTTRMRLTMAFRV
jgi:hypothetical protein